MDTKILFKYRSVTACMKASYELINGNLSSLLKKTWWTVLLYAIFMATTLYFRLPNKSLHDWGLINPMSSFILQTLVYIAFWVTNFLCGASIWTWLNKKTLSRNLAYFFVTYIVCDIFLFLFTVGGMSLLPTHKWAMVLGIVVDLILLLVTTLPFAHIVPEVMLKEKGEKFNAWKSYVQGLRHFGSIFSLGILSTIIITIITLIVMLPAIILGWAQISSQLGALDGDPLGVPGYFTPLFFLVLIISLALLNYIGAWMGVAYAFLYGSHKTIEKSRQERLQAEKDMEETQQEHELKEYQH